MLWLPKQGLIRQSNSKPKKIAPHVHQEHFLILFYYLATYNPTFYKNFPPQPDIVALRVILLSMFYIFVLDLFLNCIAETEEVDLESFLISCHNFCQSEKLESLHVSYVGPDQNLYNIPSIGIERMLQYWIASKSLHRQYDSKFN